MIKALKAFNNKTRELINSDSETQELINYNEQYNKNANSETPDETHGVILGKMAKTLLGQPDDNIKDAYKIMITNIDKHITPKNVQENFKNQLLNFIAIETSDKTEI